MSAAFFRAHRPAPQPLFALLAQGCLVRDCTSFGLSRDVRVSPGHREQNDRLFEALAALSPPRPAE